MIVCLYDNMYHTGQRGRVKRAVVARIRQRVHHVLSSSSFPARVREALRFPIHVCEPLRIPVRNGRDHMSGKDHPRVRDLMRARHICKLSAAPCTCSHCLIVAFCQYEADWYTICAVKPSLWFSLDVYF
jgi:hypothetical protein